MPAILLENVEKNFNKNKKTCNPSLYLDKFTGPCEEKDKKEVLKEITYINLNNELKHLSDSIQEKLKTNNIQSKEFELQTPLALHLSKTTMLENAAICLHPTYGFVYIPGSGIKGVARSYARQVLKMANDEIIEIFGNDNEEKDPDKMRAGKIVFYDAYPIIDNNYKLKVAINNCHNQGYYNKDEKVSKYLKKGEPNDWENPIPIYYLTLKEGAKFNFYISIRQGLQENKDLISKAWKCIAGAVSNMGIGAKTAAGYGTMITKEKNEIMNSCYLPENQEKYKKLDFYIKFLTPALLGGSNKGEDKDDCELSVNTLRGQLRWWWRRIYPNLDPKDLLEKENKIWGSTENSSPIRIEISEYKIKKSDKVIQSFQYIAFGCAKNSKLEVNGRFYLENGIYSVSITCTDSYVYNEQNKKMEKVYNKDEIMGEFKNALYLLSKHGGLGAKSRKGFGSFICIEDINTNKELQLEKPKVSLNTKDISLNTTTPLIKLNNAYFNFCKSQGGMFKKSKEYKNNKNIKATLGLPRKSGNGINYLLPTHPSKNLYNLNNSMKLRHASPVIFHLEPKNKGYIIRMTYFLSDYLISKKISEEFYKDLCDYLEKNL